MRQVKSIFESNYDQFLYVKVVFIIYLYPSRWVTHEKEQTKKDKNDPVVIPCSFKHV